MESIIPGKTGWLARPKDVNSLAEALVAALSLGPPQRKMLAKAARRHIEKKFFDRDHVFPNDKNLPPGA